MINAIEIDELKEAKNNTIYSVCTLVSNYHEYQIMLNSYEKAGFTSDICEYIYIDNSKKNKYNAFTGLNKFIIKASGKFIIFTHQDVETNFDNESILNKRIKELDIRDPQWAVLSNAGGKDIKRLFKRISHIDHELNQGPFPTQVNTIDENFIILKKDSGLRFSEELKGFHFYGTDLCLQANLQGFTCWVIDFHLLHKSTGTLNDSFFKARKEFIQFYSGKIRARYIRTPCTIMFISGNPFINCIMNLPISISLAKFVKKMQLLMTNPS